MADKEEERLAAHNITIIRTSTQHIAYYAMGQIRAPFTNVGFKMHESAFGGPINPLGLFLRTLHLPRLFGLRVGTVTNKMPGIKTYYMNIEGVARRTISHRERLKIEPFL